MKLGSSCLQMLWYFNPSFIANHKRSFTQCIWQSIIEPQFLSFEDAKRYKAVPASISVGKTSRTWSLQNSGSTIEVYTGVFTVGAQLGEDWE